MLFCVAKKVWRNRPRPGGSLQIALVALAALAWYPAARLAVEKRVLFGKDVYKKRAEAIFSLLLLGYATIGVFYGK